MRALRHRLLVTASLGTLAATLYRYPPTQFHFYPMCPIHHCTGLLCPGCGATRALAALLRGSFADALHLNGFFVLVILPCAFCYLVLALRQGARPRIPASAAWAFALAAAVFTVARNIR